MAVSHRRATGSPPCGAQASTPPPAVGPLPLGEERDLHPRLRALLHRVQAAEVTAVGAHRRPTLRLMREVLGAAVRLGIPIDLLAECLDRSRSSVRNRASGSDGTLTAELIKELTDLTPPQLNRLSKGALTRHADPANHPTGQPTYLTIDVVRALLQTPRRPRVISPESASSRAGTAQRERSSRR